MLANHNGTLLCIETKTVHLDPHMHIRRNTCSDMDTHACNSQCLGYLSSCLVPLGFRKVTSAGVYRSNENSNNTHLPFGDIACFFSTPTLRPSLDLTHHELSQQCHLYIAQSGNRPLSLSQYQKITSSSPPTNICSSQLHLESYLGTHPAYTSYSEAVDLV